MSIKEVPGFNHLWVRPVRPPDRTRRGGSFTSCPGRLGGKPQVSSLGSGRLTVTLFLGLFLGGGAAAGSSEAAGAGSVGG